MHICLWHSLIEIWFGKAVCMQVAFRFSYRLTRLNSVERRSKATEDRACPRWAEVDLLRALGQSDSSRADGPALRETDQLDPLPSVWSECFIAIEHAHQLGFRLVPQRTSRYVAQLYTEYQSRIIYSLVNQIICISRSVRRFVCLSVGLCASVCLSECPSTCLCYLSLFSYKTLQSISVTSSELVCVQMSVCMWLYACVGVHVCLSACLLPCMYVYP